MGPPRPGQGNRPRASMTEGPTETLNQNILMVANRATGTISADIFLHYLPLIFPSFPTSASNLVYQQSSSTLSKSPQQIRKHLCLFLPGWLNCNKKSLDSILQNTLSYFLMNKKFKDMFADYDICIVFKNNRSIKNLIVKTKL